MKILRTISAARCAISDRIMITRGAKGKYPLDDENYYKTLVNISGPSTHNPKKIAKSFYAAYQHNMERITYIENMMNMLKEPSMLSKIYHRMFKK